MNYRVALWRSPLSTWYEIEIPVQAENAREAVKGALTQHRAASMGVVIVMSSEKQETFENVCLIDGEITYDQFHDHLRFAGAEPFDSPVLSGSLTRALTNMRYVVEGFPDWESGRLIDIVNHLPPGARLTTTEAFTRVVGRKLVGVSILQACGAIVDSGYQEKEAELSADGATISVYAGGLWIPWPVLSVQYEADSK